MEDITYPSSLGYKEERKKRGGEEEEGEEEEEEEEERSLRGYSSSFKLRPKSNVFG